MSFLRITSPSSYRPRQKITRVSPPGNSSSSSTTLSSPAESSLPISMDNQQLYEDPTMDDDVLDDEDPDDPASPVARGVIQDRRTCKSFNGEVVWPPKVETALIGALEALLPTTIENCVSKLNLFPDRNKFCSSWIKEKTGYERTPRQVGSRIQMLRQKWRGTDSFRLVALPKELDASGQVHPDLPAKAEAEAKARGERRRRKAEIKSEEIEKGNALPVFGSTFAPLQPPVVSDLMFWTGMRSRRPLSPPPSSARSVQQQQQCSSSSSSAADPQLVQGYPQRYSQFHLPLQYFRVDVELPYIHATPSPTSSSATLLSPFSPSPYDLQSTISLSSPVPLHTQSSSLVYCDGKLVDQETVLVVLTSGPVPTGSGTGLSKENGGVWHYVTELVPKTWPKMLSLGEKIARYEVIQEIFQVGQQIDHDAIRNDPELCRICPACSSEASQASLNSHWQHRHPSDPLLVVVYNFHVAPPPPPVPAPRPLPSTSTTRSPVTDLKNMLPPERDRKRPRQDSLISSSKRERMNSLNGMMKSELPSPSASEDLSPLSSFYPSNNNVPPTSPVHPHHPPTPRQHASAHAHVSHVRHSQMPSTVTPFAPHGHQGHSHEFGPRQGSSEPLPGQHNIAHHSVAPDSGRRHEGAEFGLGEAYVRMERFSRQRSASDGSERNEMMDLTSNSTSMNGNSGPVYSATIPHQGSQFHSHPQTHYVMSSPRLATNAPISNLPFGIPAPSHPHPLTHQPHPQHHRINGDAVYTSDVSGSRIPNNNVHSGSGSGYHLSSSASASTATMGSMNGHIHHQGQGHGHGHGGSGLSGFTPANAGLAVGDHGQVSPVIMNSGMPMVMESGLGYMDHDDGVGVGAMAGMHTGNGIGGMNCQWGVKRETTVNPCSRIPYGGPQAF